MSLKHKYFSALAGTFFVSSQLKVASSQSLILYTPQGSAMQEVNYEDLFVTKLHDNAPQSDALQDNSFLDNVLNTADSISQSPSYNPTPTPSTTSSHNPSSNPSLTSSSKPSSSQNPSFSPSTIPSLSKNPSVSPSSSFAPSLSQNPTHEPSASPTKPWIDWSEWIGGNIPTSTQSFLEETLITDAPTTEPTKSPIVAESNSPSFYSSVTPSFTTTQTNELELINAPKVPITNNPTSASTDLTTNDPTSASTDLPTNEPSSTPTISSTDDPTSNPTVSHNPTSLPTPSPTNIPTSSPTEKPTFPKAVKGRGYWNYNINTKYGPNDRWNRVDGDPIFEEITGKSTNRCDDDDKQSPVDLVVETDCKDDHQIQPHVSTFVFRISLIHILRFLFFFFGFS